MAYKDTSRDWLYFAQSDLVAAERLFEEELYHLVCFHAHQAIEKIFKGMMRSKGQNIPRTHDIISLHHIILALIDELPVSADDMGFVNRFYIPTRYPDTFPGALAEGLPTKEDASRALEIARETLACIANKLTDKTEQKN